MACMSHSCPDCGYKWEDNETRPFCPKCNSPNVVSTYDECEETDRD